jgi:hypothetical protein
VTAWEGPLLLTIVGDPEIKRLQWLGQLPPGAMPSNREAMVRDIHYVALEGEETEVFHTRMKKIASEGSKPYPFVLLGCPENAEPLREAQPYSPSSRHVDA